MLRTAAERWPATRLVVVPIPVQGAVEARICATLAGLLEQAEILGLEAIVLARGGGSREDLAVFDGESLARLLAHCPLPVVTGLGHEDDTTIADLVADYRAATPTAAIVALLPDRPAALQRIQQERRQLHSLLRLRLEGIARLDHDRRQQLQLWQPSRALEARRRELAQRRHLLEALSPERLLSKGFCLLRQSNGKLVRSVEQLAPGNAIEAQVADGRAEALVTAVHSTAHLPLQRPAPHRPHECQRTRPDEKAPVQGRREHGCAGESPWGNQRLGQGHRWPQLPPGPHRHGSGHRPAAVGRPGGRADG